MAEGKRLLRGSIIITAGRVGGYGLSFVRNMILARFLTKADFGLAVLFVTTVSLLELAARMAFGQQLLQARKGNSGAFQATSHAFQSLLGLAGAIVVCVVSRPVAQMLSVPEQAWAFMLLAIVPFARGLEHLDSYRQQRYLNYIPAALVEVVPHVVITAMAWPLAVWFGDFRVVVWLMITRAVLATVVTHTLAKRPYRWAWSGHYATLMWSFGWPLLLNSVVMFAAQQADQFLIGRFVSVAELASYALALSLVSVPWFVFGQTASSLMLPMLSRVQNDPIQFRQQYQRCIELAGLGAVICLLPLIVGGEQLVTLLFGKKYAGTGALVALLGAASAVRFLRIVPSIAAMARADTINQFYSNLWRSISLPLAGVVVVSGGGVLMVAACPLIAEIVAVAYAWKRLRQRQMVPLRDASGVAAYVLVLIGVGLALIPLGASAWPIWGTIVAVALILGISVLAGWTLFPETLRPIAKIVLHSLRQPKSLATGA